MLDSSKVAAIAQTHADSTKQPLIVVLGPTASGKTALSIGLCQSLGKAEVVNADSRQLYKYLNIGTAKITPKEMQGVPHHLIDVLDPKEEATAGWYKQAARAVIADILSRGKVPVLVGGSMLYLASIIDNLTLGPTGGRNVRAQLEQKYDEDNGVTLYKMLQEIDPAQAALIHQHNRPRVVRAVEIFELSKQPKSKAVPQTELGQGGECPYDLLILGVTRERSDLHERINSRCQQMLAAGWVDEVQGLINKGYSSIHPGLKSHGYRELVQYLTTGKPESLAALETVIAAKTRQYARRQETWWRGDERIKWVAGAPATLKT